MSVTIEKLAEHIKTSREIYPFEGAGIQSKSCGLTVIGSGLDEGQEGNDAGAEKAVFIFSDLNNGTSVPDAIPQLATEVYLMRYNWLSPEEIYVLQHSGELKVDSLKQEMAEKHELEFTPRPDEFQLVVLKWNGDAFESPRWKKLNSEELAELIPNLNS